NKVRLLQKYVIIAWIIVALQILINIAGIILVLSMKNPFLEYCIGQDNAEDSCLSTYNVLIPIEIVQDSFVIIIS
ncbi:8002_t:CDS:1, partial [Ambispora gerdemannii]